MFRICQTINVILSFDFSHLRDTAWTYSNQYNHTADDKRKKKTEKKTVECDPF